MLPFHEFKVSPPDYFCKMKTQDRFLNSNNSKLDEDKDDEVIITLEVPRADQTIVITSDSESDDSDITVLPTEKFKPKPNGQLVTDSMNEPVVNLESDDDLFVYDDKSLFDATSDVVKGNDPFLSANIGVNEDDCKVRLFDIDFSYQSSTKKSESVESTPVGIAQGILDIHAPLAKPVFLTSNALPENDSSAPVDVLFNDPFSKASHASYSITHMTPSENETAAFKNSVSSHENSTITTKKKLLRNYLSKNSSKDLTVRKSSNTHSDSSWSVVSTEKNKVVLRRSPRTKLHKRAENSKKRSANSPQICKKKSRQTENQISNKFSAVNNQDTKTWSINKLSDIGSSQSLPAFVNSNPQEEQSMCYGCKLNFGVSQLSYCMAGHGCCGQCIQIQVKSLLAKGRKGVLKCRYIACNSFYLVSQLRNSLPPMVVEILEEKLDREYCDNAAKLMMQASGHCSNNCPSKDCITAKDGHGCQTNLMSDDEEDDEHQKQDPNFYQNLPRTWEPMPKSEEYRLVELCKSSEEYNWVAAMFHQTMTRPRATIVKIKLLQNPILWQFYNVKKTQMERDSTRPVIEKNLFHGTGKKAVEAICRTNFDWRLCGSHGTSYGQGSYFARDAAYSHMYTDQPAPSSLHRHLQAPLQNAILFNTSQSSQISQQPHHIPSHPHHVNQSSAGQLAHQIIFQTFPGTSHSVSIAALQSCRFARIPLGPSGAPQQVVIPPTGVPPTAISFHHYWSLNGGSSASGSQLPQLSRPNGSVLHPSSANKQLHPAGQHHHHSHHLPASHLGHHGHHIPHQPINLTISQQDHIHVMFLARVLVGDYTLGKNSYRKPPSRDPSDPYGKCYDACVNDITNPTIYVIFNSSQCYPEYIIEYTNKPREM